MTTWLDGWEKIEGNDSGSWASGPTRPKLLLHTTEGSSIAGAVGAYKANNSWPHVTVDPIRKTRVQHVPLTKPARALRNSATPGETNRAPIVIQVEIVGRAAESHDWSEAALVWLGREVVGPLCTAASIPLVAPREFLGTKAGHTLASVTAKQRLTAAQWRDLSGIFGHQHAPENCVAIDTPVLGADLVWRPAAEYRPGDEVIGCDEDLVEVGSTGGRRMRRAVVEVNEPFLCGDAVRVVTEAGTVVTTPDHPWLVRWPYVNRGTRTSWVTSAELDPSKHEVYFTAKPWEADRTHDAGWLAGALDADGHAQSSRDAGAWVGFGQVHGPMLDRFVSEMESRGFLIKQFDRTGRGGLGANPKPFMDVRVGGGLWEQLRCLGTLRPHRLNLDAAWEGAVVGKTSRRVKVLFTEPAGEVWMSGMQTSTRSFIGGGFHMHNTHWDPGALNIGRIIQAAKGYGPLYPSTPTGPSTEDTDMTDADRKMLADALAEARAAGLRAAHCEQLLAEQAEQLKQFYGSLRGWSVAIAEKVGASREDAVRNDPHATKP